MIPTAATTTAAPAADDTPFPLTRAAALARLDAFLPVAGEAYGRLRNLEHGAGNHRHVSRLSAALRRRLVSEAEVVSAVVQRHGATRAEKFISEVFWRTYWKGWLEQRPALWHGYLAAVSRAEALAAGESALSRRLAAARSGTTGIDCFDGWIGELRQTGYLHNWARMQVASIWIFTLGLRWELGAAFFLEHLIDADPASNTLSWRWVAGLHTAGKAYLADAARITAMTDGRYRPRELARVASIPAETLTVPSPVMPPLPATVEPPAAGLLLLTTEDLSPETLPVWQRAEPQAIAVLPGDTAADVMALADALSRAAARWPSALVLGEASADTFAQARQAGCRSLVTAHAPVGPVATRLQALQPVAAASGRPVTPVLRDWDRHAWPHCRKGFFGLKEKIPALLRQNGVSG